MNIRRHLPYSFLLAGICLFFLTACLTTSSGEKWKPLKKKKSSLVHTVQWAEETLPMVASWYTASEDNWKIVANGNPNIVPGHLRVGDRIFIDVVLLKKRTPMSRVFVASFLAPPSTPPEPAPLAEAPVVTAPPPALKPGLYKKKVTPQPEATPAAILPRPQDAEFELFGPK